MTQSGSYLISAMKAYKFRSAQQLNFVMDILVRKRLYCCHSDVLNDIREGDLLRSGTDAGRGNEVSDYGLEVGKEMKSLRICSLSRTFNNHLLWAHYASGYSGVAIEVELDDAEAVEVTYSNDFIFLSAFIDSASPEAVARKALVQKWRDWQHEEEVRIITKSEFYPLVRPISRVIVGARTDSALVSALCLVCSHFGIPVERAVLADWGIYAIGVQPMNL